MRSPILLALCLGCGASPAPVEPAGPRGDAIRAYTQAELLIRDGHLPRAAELYDRAASLDPSSVQIWLAGARARVRLHQWGHAITRAGRAYALAPADGEVVDTLGHALLAAREVDRAGEVYREFVRRAPKDARGWAGLSVVASMNGDFEAAERSLERATEHAPESADYWTRLGAVRRRLHRPAAAAQALERSAQLDPGSDKMNKDILELALRGFDPNVATSAAARLVGPKMAPLHVADRLIRSKDLVAAAGVLERLLQSDPERHDARLLLANIHRLAELAERATTLALAIPDSAPQWVDAQRLLASLHAKAGDLEAAIERFEAAARVAPDRKDVATGLAYARERAGDLEQARADLSKAIERWPADAAIRFNHALVTNRLGDDDGALKAMFGVLSVEPDHPGALNFIGYVWAVRGQRLEDAEAYIRKALERRPDNGAIVDSLGWVLFKRGQLEAAEATLRRAVALRPDEGEIHYHLAEVLWAAGRRKEARRHYDLAVDKTQDDSERKRYEARRRARR